MNLPTILAYGCFFFLVGLCVGSFLNVVIWRLPYRGREVVYLEKRGRLTLSWPPSHCPVCDSPIRWYQNIPVISWMALRGRCAKCGTGIPVRYPLVELGTGVMFLGIYLAYFLAGWQVGIGDLRTDWPPYALHVVFAAALLAASAIDADLFIIPLGIPWFLAVVGVVAAGLIGPPLMGKSFPIVPSLVVPNLGANFWGLAKPIVGAMVGLVLANVLMMLKLMPRSFEGMDEAREVLAKESVTSSKKKDRGFAINGKADQGHGEKGSPKQEETMAPPPKLTRYWPAVAAAVLIVAVVIILWMVVSAKAAALGMLVGGMLIFLIGVLPRDAGQVDVTDEVMEEISSPHARREVLKELLFLAVPGVCGVIAYFVPVEIPHGEWVGRVLGSLLGLLVGGGIVWVVRVGGSLAFGKEAMGMGDAHLMAGVGAVIGGPLAAVAFFLMAPVLGILWAIVLKVMGKPNVLPYGPWLAMASILSLFLGNPLIEWDLKVMLGGGAVPVMH